MVNSSTVQAADGTALRAWSNGGIGVPVVISNGLGTPPTAWPTVMAAGSGFRAVTWSHRGLGGSGRPADPDAVRIQDHVNDLRCVMDAEGMDRALVVGWSIGVGVAFRFAELHPERVAGILGVAGVPGGSLQGMFGSLGLPRRLREPAGRLSTRLLPVVGPGLSVLAAGLPRADHPFSLTGLEAVAREVRHAHSMMAVARAFAEHDWDWFTKLALAAGEQRPMDMSIVTCPVTLLAGRHDAVTSSRDILAVAAAIPDARVRVLPAGTHFVPLQYPDLMLDELRLLAARTGLHPVPDSG